MTSKHLNDSQVLIVSWVLVQLFQVMRVPKRLLVFSQWNIKFYSCTQMVILFFFLQRNTKFYICTQTAIRFLQRNTKFYSGFQIAIRFFYNETQNFEICTQTANCFQERNREFWKLYPNGQFVFPTRKYEI